MDDGGCSRKHLGPIKGISRKRLPGAGLFCGGRGFQIISKPVESVPGASGKPAVNCRLRFVAAEGEKGALRLPPPPKSRHEVRQHSSRRAVPMDDGGCSRKHLGPIKGISRKRLPGAGLFCGGRGFQIIRQPVESVPGARRKPENNY